MAPLFEPGRVGSIEIPNRFVRSATVECLADDHGAISPAYRRLYERLARHDVGLIITGCFYVSDDGRAIPRQPKLYDGELLGQLRTVTDAVHELGGRIVGQINHAGRQASPSLIGCRPLAPSPVRDRLSGVRPRALGHGDIARIIRDFAMTARRVRDEGFDGVQLLAAHGYLISSFLSPYTNRRRDDWGGELDGRMRFLLAVFDSVRDAVGPSFPILVKINAEDGVEGGLSFEDCVAACRALDERGVAALGWPPEAGAR